MTQPVKWRRSFRYAYEGVKYALSTQRNMRFHFAASLIALTLAFLFNLSKTDVLFILLAVTLVIVTELVNTAIEKTVDLAMPDLHPLAKIAKDVAAASVLVTAAFAVITGMIVFYEPVDSLLRQARETDATLSAGTVWVLLCLVVLAAIVLQTRLSQREGSFKPSILSALAFAAATLIVCWTRETLPGLLAFFLAAMVGLIIYEKSSRSFISMLSGAVIGSMIAFLAYYLYLIY